MNINALSSLSFKRSHIALVERDLSQNIPLSLESELEISNKGRVASSDTPQPVLRFADYLRQKGISNVVYHSFNDMSKEKSSMLDNTEKIKVCDLARLAKKFTEPSVDTSYVSLFLQDLKKIPEWCNFDNKKLSGEESMGTLSTSSKDALSISSTLCDNHMLHSIVNLYPMNINSDNWDDDDWDDDDFDDDDFDDDDWDDEKKSEVINHSYQNIDLLKQITIKALRNTGYEAEINNKLEPESLEDQINSLIGEKDLGLLDLNDPKPYDDFPKFDYKQEWERLSDDASWMNPEQED